MLLNELNDLKRDATVLDERMKRLSIDNEKIVGYKNGQRLPILS